MNMILEELATSVFVFAVTASFRTAPALLKSQMWDVSVETPKEQTPALPPSLQLPQPRPQIVEKRWLFGGRTRSYERNGTMAEIPNSVGTDEASVNRFMDEMNNMIDMMD